MREDGRYGLLTGRQKDGCGRRNLTTDQRSDLRGRRYNLTKQKQGGDRKSEAASKSQNDTLIDTATALAEQHGVSRTVIRDGKNPTLPTSTAAPAAGATLAAQTGTGKT